MIRRLIIAAALALVAATAVTAASAPAQARDTSWICPSC